MKRTITLIIAFDVLTLSPPARAEAVKKPPSESTIRRCIGSLAAAFPKLSFASWELLTCDSKNVSARAKSGRSFLVDRDGKVWEQLAPGGIEGVK